MGTEYPDNHWPEDRIISVLRSCVTASDAVGRGQRLRCLEILCKRRKIVNAGELFPLLVETSKTYGDSKPERNLLIEIFSKLLKKDEKWLNLFLEKVSEKHEHLASIAASVLISTKKPKQRRKVIDHFLSVLFSWGAFLNATDEICQTVTGYTDSASRIHAMEHVSRYLESPDPFQAVYAMRIAARLGTRDVTTALCEVARKSTKGWYDGHASQVQDEFGNFALRTRDRRTISTLLNVLKESQSTQALQALAALADRLTVHQVLAILTESITLQNYGCVQRCFIFLEDVDPVKIDAQELLSLRNRIGFDMRSSLVRVVDRLGERAKPQLLRILRDCGERDYEFAVMCLTNIGTTLEEMSEVFESNQIETVHDFLYSKRKLSLQTLWREKEKLGDSMKNVRVTRLEHFLLNLLNAFAFVTVFADPAGVPGVDIVGFSPASPHLMLIGCTTGVFKEDLQQLQVSTDELRRSLPSLARKLDVLPIIVTSSDLEIHPSDLEYASHNEIVILVRSDIEKLVFMLKTKRTARDVVQFLVRSRNEMRSP